MPLDSMSDNPRRPIEAANDDWHADRPPATRWITIEGLLEWTYRRQLAHRYLRSATDFFLWSADRAGIVDAPHDRRPVHHDAAIVHAHVLGLGPDVARLIIESAAVAIWPERVEELPRPYPYPPERADSYEETGWYVRGDGRRQHYLVRTSEIVAEPRIEAERIGRKKIRLRTVGWDRVPVRYCPLVWEPEPEFAAAENARHACWLAARETLIAQLRVAPLRDHMLDSAAAI